MAILKVWESGCFAPFLLPSFMGVKKATREHLLTAAILHVWPAAEKEFSWTARCLYPQLREKELDKGATVA